MNTLNGFISNRSLFVGVMVGLVLGLSMPAQAALIDRGLFDADGVSGGGVEMEKKGILPKGKG